MSCQISRLFSSSLFCKSLNRRLNRCKMPLSSFLTLVEIWAGLLKAEISIQYRNSHKKVKAFHVNFGRSIDRIISVSILCIFQNQIRFPIQFNYFIDSFNCLLLGVSCSCLVKCSLICHCCCSCFQQVLVNWALNYFLNQLKEK